MSYHGRYAVQHFSRQLCGEARKSGRRRPWRALAVLGWLWMQVEDAYEDTPRVVVAWHEMPGISSNVTWRRTIVLLAAVGAVRRYEIGYVLLRPSLTALDETVRVEAEKSRSKAPKVVIKKAGPTADERDELLTQRRAALKKLGKRPSDVRDVLAAVCQVKPATMRFAGKGSEPVQAAIDWLASTGASWKLFVHICARTAKDEPDNRPDDLRWLFAPRHSDYVNSHMPGAK